MLIDNRISACARVHPWCHCCKNALKYTSVQKFFATDSLTHSKLTTQRHVYKHLFGKRLSNEWSSNCKLPLQIPTIMIMWMMLMLVLGDADGITHTYEVFSIYLYELGGTTSDI